MITITIWNDNANDNDNGINNNNYDNDGIWEEVQLWFSREFSTKQSWQEIQKNKY